MADSVITMPPPYATIQHWHGSDGHASTVSNALLRITDLPFVTGLWGGTLLLDFPGGSDGKASVYNVGDLGLIPGSGRSPGEGNGNPLQYSCLENPMDRGAWYPWGHKSQTRLSNFTFTLLLHPILQMGKLRHREVEKLAQSHTVSGTGWDLDLAVWLQSPGHSKAT